LHFESKKAKEREGKKKRREKGSGTSRGGVTDAEKAKKRFGQASYRTGAKN